MKSVYSVASIKYTFWLKEDFCNFENSKLHNLYLLILRNLFGQNSFILSQTGRNYEITILWGFALLRYRFTLCYKKTQLIDAAKQNLGLFSIVLLLLETATILPGKFPTLVPRYISKVLFIRCYGCPKYCQSFLVSLFIMFCSSTLAVTDWGNNRLGRKNIEKKTKSVRLSQLQLVLSDKRPHTQCTTLKGHFLNRIVHPLWLPLGIVVRTPASQPIGSLMFSGKFEQQVTVDQKYWNSKEENFLDYYAN